MHFYFFIGTVIVLVVVGYFFYTGMVRRHKRMIALAADLIERQEKLLASFESVYPLYLSHRFAWREIMRKVKKETYQEIIRLAEDELTHLQLMTSNYYVEGSDAPEFETRKRKLVRFVTDAVSDKDKLRTLLEEVRKIPPPPLRTSILKVAGK